MLFVNAANAAAFESVTAMDTSTCDVAEEQPEQVRCGVVESNFLRLLRVRVALGRDFTPEDEVRGRCVWPSSAMSCGSGAMAQVCPSSDARGSVGACGSALERELQRIAVE